MKQFSAIFCLTSLTLLLGQTDARAGFVNWTYNWSRVPADVVSADAFGTSRISLTDEPLGRASDSSDIVATNLRTTSSAPRGNPNHFLDAAYSLTLRLTDDASGQSGVLTFTGVFNGTLSASSANISTQLTSSTTRSLLLGGNEYVVSIGDYSPPGPPGTSNSGSIGASVEVRATERPSDVPNDVPEPSAVVLSCLGLSCVAAASWRRWKRRRLAVCSPA